jgi:hypothetical protein
MNAAARKGLPANGSTPRRNVAADLRAAEDARLREDQALLNEFFKSDSTAKKPSGRSSSESARSSPTRAAAMPPIAQASHILELERQSDETLAERLQSELRRSGVRAFANLTINVVDGMAHLQGALDSHYELVIALQLVGRTSGIAGVRHSITVKPELVEKVTWTEIAIETVRENRRLIRQWVKVAVAVLVLGTVSVAWARFWPSRFVPPVPVVPASGTVEVGGKPAAGAILKFYPVDSKTRLPSLPQALADDTGRFVLSTFQRNDGAPVGEYIVTVTWRPDVTTKNGRTERGPNVVPVRFTKPESSTLRAIVPREGGEVGGVIVPR